MYTLSKRKKALVLFLTMILLSLVFYVAATLTSMNDSVSINLIGRKFLASDQSFLYFFLTEEQLLKKTPEQEVLLEYTVDEGIYFIQDNDEEIQALPLNKGQELYLLNQNKYMFIVLE